MKPSKKECISYFNDNGIKDIAKLSGPIQKDGGWSFVIQLKGKTHNYKYGLAHNITYKDWDEWKKIRNFKII